MLDRSSRDDDSCHPHQKTKKERLFHLGVDPRVVSRENGQTLLHAAVGRGSRRVAKLVVRAAVYDAHPPRKRFLDARANDGTTSLDVARAAGFERIAEWLEALGAKSGFDFDRGGDRTAAGAYATSRHNHPYASAPSAGLHHHHYPGGPSFFPPPPYGGADASAARGGWPPPPGPPPAPPPAPAPTDAYLLGALESVLGDLNETGETRSTDDRKRARVLVRRVSELCEDLDDYKYDLEASLLRCDKAELRVKQLTNALRIAETERDGALRVAKETVATQRAEEQKAVLDALGLAETRAVRMAHERETLREERDAIAEALAFVKEEKRALFSKTNETETGTGGGGVNAAEEDEDEDEDEDEHARTGSRNFPGIEPRGGGLHEVEIPRRETNDTVDDAAETLQMLEVPLGD